MLLTSASLERGYYELRHQGPEVRVLRLGDRPRVAPYRLKGAIVCWQGRQPTLSGLSVGNANSATAGY